MCCSCNGGNWDYGNDWHTYDPVPGECRDSNYDANNYLIGDSYGDLCSDYYENTQWCGNYDTDTFNSYEMCCACEGL